jgi:raffinose/stachyose/melibiose transport system substrate-binding protein
MAGDTAVFINGPWYIGRIKNDAPDTYAATKLTAAPKVGEYHGHQLGFMLSNLAAANTDDQRQRDAVVKWMRFMTEPDNARFVSEAAGSMFAIKYELTADADPLQREFVRAASDASFVMGRFTDHHPVSAVAEFGQALSAMALGEATPAEFIDMLISASK